VNVIVLTEQERARFAAYLDQEAATSEGLAEQAAKLRMYEPLVERLRGEALAYRRIAQVLRSWEKERL